MRAWPIAAVSADSVRTPLRRSKWLKSRRCWPFRTCRRGVHDQGHLPAIPRSSRLLIAVITVGAVAGCPPRRGVEPPPTGDDSPPAQPPLREPLPPVSRDQDLVGNVGAMADYVRDLDELERTAPDLMREQQDQLLKRVNRPSNRNRWRNAPNAWKFTSKRATARIELGAQPHQGRTAYFVRDDGAGFDPEFSRKLFTAFQRLHAPSDFEGTGVGLSIVRRVIQRHGGQVWAEGQLDAGATFYFTLGDSSGRVETPLASGAD